MAPRKRRPHAEFSEEALDALIGDAKTPEDLDAWFRRMKKAFAERILGVELTHAPSRLRTRGSETGRAVE